MTGQTTIALIGDYSADVIAHRAIPLAIERNAGDAGISASYQWIDTDRIDDAPSVLADFDAVWCVPASPYRFMQGALDAIRFARQSGRAFLGTCGGYQHAALEYCRNVRGHQQAGNGEVDPDTEMPVVGALACALREVADGIELLPDSKIASIYGASKISETYNCGFGVNPAYLDDIVDEDMRVGAVDAAGDPRSLELKNHHFFVVTAFQPERSALEDRPHPLVRAFIEAATPRL